ncbi:MAG: hypothetical protein H0V31_03390 [Acidobacteria bacterium]|nr:hypothetical protein [Acidobacteriota bacterium]
MKRRFWLYTLVPVFGYAVGVALYYAKWLRGFIKQYRIIGLSFWQRCGRWLMSKNYFGIAACGTTKGFGFSAANGIGKI